MEPIMPTENQPIEIEKAPFWKQKKVFALCLGILLALFIATFFIQKPLHLPQGSFPTPTPIPPPVNGYQQISIIESPIDNSTNNSLFATISATFSRPLTSAEKAYTKLVVQPTIVGALVWSNTNDAVTLTPFMNLPTDTTYTVTLTYGSTIKSWSFKTVSESALSQQDENSIQLQSDDQFGAWQNQLYGEYPWYNNLPLQTPDYYTYFDIDTKQFISTLYVASTDTDKVQSLKAEILQKLQSFGINTDSYKFIWGTTP